LPRTAIDQGDGTSHFSPPGSSGLVWVFDNLTGDILSSCTTAPWTCNNTRALLLAGFVRFATADPPVQPTEVQAEIPPSPAFPVTVQVDATAPSTATIPCYTETTQSYVAYYCAMPVAVNPPYLWAGRARLGGFTIATLADPTSLTAFRVCRYTPVRDCQPSVGATIWGAPGTTASCSGSAPTPSRLMTNQDHPLEYTDVSTSLANKNFLVIRAGDGMPPAFECPGDDTSTPLINGNTWRHQPAS
jgi:hypothetical protein